MTPWSASGVVRNAPVGGLAASADPSFPEGRVPALGVTSDGSIGPAQAPMNTTTTSAMAVATAPRRRPLRITLEPLRISIPPARTSDRAWDETRQAPADRLNDSPGETFRRVLPRRLEGAGSAGAGLVSLRGGRSHGGVTPESRHF